MCHTPPELWPAALMKHEGAKCKFLQLCWWTSLLMCKAQEMVYWGPPDSDLCIPLGLSLPGRDAEKNSSLKPELLCVPTDHGGCAQRSRHSHEPSPGPRAHWPRQHGRQGGGRSGWWSGGPLTMSTYLMQSWLYCELIYSILIRGPGSVTCCCHTAFWSLPRNLFFLLDCTSNSIRVNTFSQAQHTEIHMYMLLESWF